jgi:chemotaxis protein CheD
MFSGSKLSGEIQQAGPVLYAGIGEWKVSDLQGQVIKSLALGSCIAVIALSKKTSATGILHVQLPESAVNKDLAHSRPGLFADTGIPILLNEMKKLGCSPGDLLIKLAGGAQVIDPRNTFNIGKRNYLAIKKILWALRLWPLKEAVGGEKSRTVTVRVGSKEVIIASPGVPELII